MKNAEAMLFVNHYEAEFIERDRLLNERVRAYTSVNVSRGEVFVKTPFFCCTQRAD